MSEQNTTIVIFGGAGDLSQRKLLPALFNLRCKSRLPNSIRIVGSGRREFSNDQFREMSLKGAREIGGLNVEQDEWNDFAKNLFYIDCDTSDAESVVRFKKRLEELEGGDSVNRLFYLSIAPQIFESTIANLGNSGLSNENGGWRRVVIEKPFGYDLSSAIHLNKVVSSVFQEEQVYRIDHYLGKETVQNLMVLRFANAIFEPIWNRNYIDNVQITVAEQVDVGDRGGYYDQSGVIRDMFQNHLLQLVAIVAMEPPSVADAESLRNKRVEVLQAIRRGGVSYDAVKHAVRGQYDGYLEEKGVPKDSTTATFGAMRLFIDNWRWRGVPFYLRTGKAMAQKVTEVIIQFQQPPHSMFALGPSESLPSNILGICVQPDEGSHLQLGVKVPDMGMKVQPVDMEFRYDQVFKEQPIQEAYELLLEDAIEGDAGLFIRSDQIEASWRIVDPLLHAWEDHESSPLFIYPRDSWGPKAADELLAQDGRSWQRACGSHE